MIRITLVSLALLLAACSDGARRPRDNDDGGGGSSAETTGGSAGSGGASGGGAGGEAGSATDSHALEVLSDIVDYPKDIAGDDKNVFFIEKSTIRSVSKESGALTVATGVGSGWRVALDDANLYFTNYLGSLNQTSRTTGETMTLVVYGTPWDLVSDGQYIYWTGNEQSGKVVRTPVGSYDTEVIGTGNYPDRIALDATHVYWSNAGSNSIARATKDGSQEEVLAKSLSEPAALALDESHVYWAEGWDIVRLAKAGGEPQTLNTDHHSFAKALAVDDTHVYYLRDAEEGLGWVLVRIPKTGGAEEILFSGTSLGEAVYVDATHVYWATREQLLRYAK
jgi:hypothetical protein